MNEWEERGGVKRGAHLSSMDYCCLDNFISILTWMKWLDLVREGNEKW